MAGFLRKATDGQSRAMGPFVDETDFKTPETALTIANTDIHLVTNGTATTKHSGGGTHLVNGVYVVTFDAVDTPSCGELEMNVYISGALSVFDKFYVVEGVVFDALYADDAEGFGELIDRLEVLDVDLTEVLARLPTPLIGGRMKTYRYTKKPRP